MAEDEMKTITEDKWDAELWGVEHHEPDRKYNIPKLIFYFAQNVSFSNPSPDFYVTHLTLFLLPSNPSRKRDS